MIDIGDPHFRDKNGYKTEVEIRTGGQAVAIVHGNFIEKWGLIRKDTGTGVLELRMRAPRGSSIKTLPSSGHLVLRTETAPGKLVRLGIFQIDYWNADFDESTESVDYQGRGLLAPLIDKRWSELYHGDLTDLLRDTCRAAASVNVRGIAQNTIDLHVNSPSAYAALRLLSISLGFIIRERSDDEDVIEVVGVAQAKREYFMKPPAIVTESHVEKGTMRRGEKIKRRSDESA